MGEEKMNLNKAVNYARFGLGTPTTDPERKRFANVLVKLIEQDEC